MQNSAIISGREICSGRIEGVDFGPRVWVIARSPTAMLLWVFGHSYWSGRNNQSYRSPHLTLLPDRSPRFIYRPRWKEIPIEGVRLKPHLISARARVEIGAALGIEIGQGRLLDEAILTRRTLIIEGGGGRLAPPRSDPAALIAWIGEGHRSQFVTLPEGVSMHDALRHKLGWRPKT